MKIYIAQTIDGYIAGEGDSLDHLDAFDSDEYGYEEFMQSLDAIVIGRTTFDVIYPTYGWTYPEHLPGVVLTSRPLPDDVPKNVVAGTDLEQIAKEYPNAFVDGGGNVVRQCCELDLIHEARIFTLPILIGNGIRLFPDSQSLTKRWELVEVKRFSNGATLHHYKI